LFDKNWHELLVGAILTNFFAAILEGSLEVTTDEYTISKDSLGVLFNDPRIIDALKELDDEEHLANFEASYAFYRCLESNSAYDAETQVQEPMGNFAIKILVEEGLKKEIAFLRNGMFITKNSIQSLKQFPNAKDFVAVAYCTSTKGNGILREMEPPQHNAFEGNRYDRTNGPKLLNQVGKKIRGQLKKHITPDYAEVGAVEFLADIFGVEQAEGSSSNDNPTDLNPDGKVVTKLKAVNIPVPTLNSSILEELGDEGGGDSAGRDETDESGGLDGAGSKDGAQEGSGLGGGGENKSYIERAVINPRIIYLTDGNVHAHLTIDYSGEILVKFSISGADIDESVKVQGTNVGRPFEDGVRLFVKAKERISMKVTLPKNTHGAIKVSTYEV